MTDRDPTWSELVAPTVARCELAAKLGMNATWNADGAAALGELIKRMAARLDADLEMIDGHGQ